MVEYLEFILGVLAVIILPMGGAIVKMWSDVQTMKPNIDEMKSEIKELERDKTEHAKTLAVIDQRLQHIESAMNSLNSSVVQLINTFDKLRP